MNIKYKLGFDDFLTNQLFIASKSNSIKIRMRLYRFIVSLVYFVFGILLYMNNRNLLSGIFFVISILWLFYYPMFSKKKFYKHFSDHVQNYHSKSFEKQISITLDSNEIIIKDRGKEITISVNDLEKIIEMDKIYLLAMKAGGNIVISKKLDSGNVDEFINILKEKSVLFESRLNWKW